jgi:hypothetical protein
MLRADPIRGKKNMTMNHVCSYIVMLIDSTVCKVSDPSGRYLVIRVVNKDIIFVLLHSVFYP